MIEAALGGTGGALVIRGEAGIGKSTLLSYARIGGRGAAVGVAVPRRQSGVFRRVRETFKTNHQMKALARGKPASPSGAVGRLARDQVRQAAARPSGQRDGSKANRAVTVVAAGLKNLRGRDACPPRAAGSGRFPGPIWRRLFIQQPSRRIPPSSFGKSFNLGRPSRIGHGPGIVDVNPRCKGEVGDGGGKHIDQAEWRVIGHEMPAAFGAILPLARLCFLEHRDVFGAGRNAHRLGLPETEGVHRIARTRSGRSCNGNSPSPPGSR